MEIDSFVEVASEAYTVYVTM